MSAEAARQQALVDRVRSEVGHTALGLPHPDDPKAADYYLTHGFPWQENDPVGAARAYYGMSDQDPDYMNRVLNPDRYRSE